MKSVGERVVYHGTPEGRHLWSDGPEIPEGSQGVIIEVDTDWDEYRVKFDDGNEYQVLPAEVS